MDNSIESFRAHLIENERSRETINAYMQSVLQYHGMFDEISKENMIKYKQWLLENRKPGTANLRCTGINRYLDFIGRPECKVKSIRIHSRASAENVPTDEEYNRLINGLKSDGRIKEYFMIKFMANTGCRVSELVKMEKSCLDKGEFTLWTKGKIRRILIPASLIDESKDYFKTVDSRYLFPNKYGTMMSTRGVSSQLVKYGELYNIRREVLHAHAFRHYFAIHFLKANNNLSLLQNLLGHESIATTSIYLQLSTEEQKNALNNAVNW